MNNLKNLETLLHKEQDKLRQAKKAVKHFIETQESDLEYKYVTKPADEAKKEGKSKEQINAIIKSGRATLIRELAKLENKKRNERGIKTIVKEIKAVQDDIEKAKRKSALKEDKKVTLSFGG